MPWIWRRTRRRSRGMKLFDDVGNIIGLALGKRRNAMRLRKERNKNEEYVNFQFKRLWLIQGISGILSLGL